MGKYAGRWARECEINGPLYTIWGNMRSRCKGWHKGDAKRYKDRGITYSPGWDSYAKFEEDVMDAYNDAKERYGPYVALWLDRKDVDGDYVKENVQFVSPFESATNNKSNIHDVEYCGRSNPISFWARIYGLKTGTVQCRLQRGWTIERALNQPVGNTGPKKAK